MIDRCEVDCQQHTGEVYPVRIVGLGISDRIVLCQAARDEQRSNGFKVDACDDPEDESRPMVNRPVPLRLSWRLDALNKLVADLTRAIEMNRRTIGRAEIDRRSVVSVEVVLQTALQNARELRDRAREGVEEIHGGGIDEGARP